MIITRWHSGWSSGQMSNEGTSAAGMPPPHFGAPPAPDQLGLRQRGMPPWIPRVILFAIVAVSVFLLGKWAFERLQTLIVTLLVSLFLALAIEPAVNLLARRGLRRGLATLIVFFILFVLVGGLLFALGSLFFNEVNSIAKDLPDYIDGVIRWVNNTFGTDLSSEDFRSGISVDSATLGRYGTQLATNVLGLGASVFGFIFRLFTILLFTYYLSAEGPQFRRHVVSLFPPARQGEVLRAWEIAIEKTGGYIYSRALMAVVSFVAHYILLLALDIPNALALAIWVGVVSQFIPTVGTYMAGLVPIVVALAEQPIDALWIFIFILCYQQFENYILQPKITSRTVRIHPALAFGAVVAGASLLGAIGVFIAIPIAASAQAFLSTYIRRYEVADPSLTDVRPEPGAGAAP
jgi:predicted PurR-regulated permease PerM